ncbi:erythromycin esterase family protein [Rufibacter sediminis]|uniref:erythromycin esterase family protein n=1 Tax=Rufibacter sediminis TaxID=2762756 RepID=UPI00210D99B6
MAYIKENTIAVHDMNPSNEDYTDLLPLKSVLKDTEVIGLGEQTHYDGSTFQAKTRLVKFLHQELGYGVIAFESGFYDCYKAWQEIQNGKPAIAAARKSIYPFWISAETEELFKYIDQQKNTDYPLIMAGIDCKFSGVYSRENLPSDLRAYLQSTKSEALKDTAQWLEFSTALEKAIKISDYHTKPSPQDTLVLHQTISGILKRVTSRVEANKIVSQEDLFWQQFCRSTLVEITRKFSSRQRRDEQMGSNLHFLRNDLYKDKKVIVWAASSHLTYAGTNIESDFYQQNLRLGDYLKKSYGEKYYHLGFTGYEGKIGKLLFFPLIKIKKHKENSIEYALGQTKQPFLFLDLNRQDLPDWLQAHLIARPFGYREMSMRLPQVMDGLFYTEKIFERKALPAVPEKQ